MQTQLVKISELSLPRSNPRTIKKVQMDKLCRSIQIDKSFLMCRPVLVNSVEGKMTVYAGNQRVRACKKLGMKEVPCIVQENLDDEVMKKRAILDNKTYGEFDFDMLANEWEVDLLIECGFAAEELLGNLSNISDDERAEEQEPSGTGQEDVCKECGKKL